MIKNHEDDIAAKIGHFFLKLEREKFILSLPEIESYHVHLKGKH